MKGQTAMEYLMTYGWAIVVIVLVLAALAAWFSGSQTFEYCSFSPVGSFTCDGTPTIYKTNNNVMIHVKFRNNYQDEVTLAKAICNGVETPMTGKIAPGEVHSGTDINCGNVGDVGDKFDQKVTLNYQLPSDVDVGATRSATLTVRGKIASK